MYKKPFQIQAYYTICLGFFVYTSIQIPFFVAAWSVCQTDYKLCSCKRDPYQWMNRRTYDFMYKCKYIVCFLNVCFCFKNKLVMCYFNLQICTMHTGPKNPKNVHLFWEVCFISFWVKKKTNLRIYWF